MIFALLLAGGMNLFTWWNSGIMARHLYRARPVDARGAPALHGIVRQLAEIAGLPMVCLYVIDNPQPNGFATGRGPENAAVAATTGLLQRPSREEIAGVAPAPRGGHRSRAVAAASRNRVVIPPFPAIHIILWACVFSST